MCAEGRPADGETFRTRKKPKRWAKALESAIEDGSLVCGARSGGHPGLPLPHLRHICASYLASQGASLLEIADVLGHKTVALTRRYSHLASGHKTTVVEKMAKERGL